MTVHLKGGEKSMKLKLRFLVTFFFLLIGTIIVIKTVSAIETPKPPDIKWNNSSLSGGRKWTTVTFAENMPCGETSKTIEVGDYQDGQLFVSSPSNQSNCHILVEASVDKTVWYAPEGMTAENGRVSIGDMHFSIIGPFYRIRTENGQGNFTFKAYLYSD